MNSRTVYRVILVVSDWVMLTQFRLRITSKGDGIDINITSSETTRITL